MPQDGAYREGQTATNPKTGQTIVYKNGQWVAAPAAPGAPIAQRKFSPQEQKYLAQAMDAAQESQGIMRDYDEAEKAIKRLHTGPWRGTFLDAAIPTEDGGVMDTLGGVLVGGIPRLTGALSNDDVNAYNTLRRVQSRRVLAEQKQQKGVQTEGDAARIKAGDIGVRATEDANMGAISRGRLEAQLLVDRAKFLSDWANKYGVFGNNEKGQSATQVFEQIANQRRAAMGGTPKPTGGPTIRRVK